MSLSTPKASRTLSILSGALSSVLPVGIWVSLERSAMTRPLAGRWRRLNLRRQGEEGDEPPGRRLVPRNLQAVHRRSAINHRGQLDRLGRDHRILAVERPAHYPDAPLLDPRGEGLVAEAKADP